MSVSAPSLVTSTRTMLLSVTLTSLVLLPASLSAAVPPTQLTYSGSLTPVSRDGESAPMLRFTLETTLLPTAEAVRVYHVLTEVGGRRAHWTARLESGTLATEAAATGDFHPTLPLEFGGSPYQLDLPSPIFVFPEAPAPGVSWSSEDEQCRVTRKTATDGGAVWQIECLGQLGRRHSLLVSVDDHVVVESTRHLFMGRGDEFVLRLKQESRKVLDDERLAAAGTVWNAFRRLDEALTLRERDGNAVLSDEEIAASQPIADELAGIAAAAGIKPLGDEIVTDLRRQSRRESDVAAMAAKLVGRAAPTVSFTSLTGDEVDSADWQDSILVLHFWSYNGDSLEPPYGQVGYLDFLNDKRRKLGVKVVGVAVDPQFAGPAQRAAAVRPVKKLKEFMNLGYDIVLDDGAALAKFGDPRTLGAELPLWVVVDADRQIVHYQVGFYDINPNEGLKPLDDLVIETIKRQRAAGR